MSATWTSWQGPDQRPLVAAAWSRAGFCGYQKLMQSGIAALFEARSKAAEPISSAPR